MRFIDLQLDNTEYPIPEEKHVVKIGRSRYNAITIPNTEFSRDVSGEHFFFYPNTLTIRNNGRKGTSLNGKELPETEEVRIVDGDIIRMGSYYQLLYRAE